MALFIEHGTDKEKAMTKDLIECGLSKTDELKLDISEDPSCYTYNLNELNIFIKKLHKPNIGQ